MLTKSFVTVRPKLFTGKMLHTPLFIRKIFVKPEIFSRTVGFLYKFFRHCEKNNFRRKIVTPLLCIKFFVYPKLSETLKGCLRYFRQCQTWNIRQKNVVPLICINFLIPQFFWNIAGMLNKFFGRVRPHFSNGKCVNPFLIRKKRFGTTISLKNRRIRLQKYSALWELKFLTEKRDTPYFLLSQKFSDTTIFLKHCRDAQ